MRYLPDGVSTRNLSALPDIDTLRRACQSMAMLDAILSPEWQGRYFSFNSRWAPGEAMASMDDGCGDDYFILFDAAGAILKGHAHESDLAGYNVKHDRPWPGVLDAVPADFARFLAEPAFSLEETTFCIWRRHTDTKWQIGPVSFPTGDDPDGSAELLFALDASPATYKVWAEEYYAGLLAGDLRMALVDHIYRHEPLTDEIVRAINKNVCLADLAEDIEEIGYAR